MTSENNFSTKPGRAKVISRKRDFPSKLNLDEMNRVHVDFVSNVEGNLNVQQYCDEILDPHVIPFMEGHLDDRFQQDNARPHTARIITQ
jgi:hypothetical protein